MNILAFVCTKNVMVIITSLVNIYKSFYQIKMYDYGSNKLCLHPRPLICICSCSQFSLLLFLLITVLFY
jgi:hypothetical protein